MLIADADSGEDADDGDGGGDDDGDDDGGHLNGARNHKSCSEADSNHLPIHDHCWRVWKELWWSFRIFWWLMGWWYKIMTNEGESKYDGQYMEKMNLMKGTYK